MTSFIIDIIANFVPGNWGDNTPTSKDSYAVRCIRGTDIPSVQRGDYTTVPLRYIREENNNTLRAGDIIVEKSGGSSTQSTGRVAYINNTQIDGLPIVCSNFCAGIRPDESINSKFLFYYLVAIYKTGAFFNYETRTSGIHNLMIESALSSIPFPEYSVTRQDRIAHLLSTLDDKIELNDKINRKLNELARLIYDYWFVQFDFPDEHGRPYRVSGGKMVYNDLLKRDIPEGWKAEYLNKMLTFNRGTEPGAKAYLNGKINDGCIKFYRVRDMLGTCSTWIDSEAYKLYKVAPGDVLVSFDATIGRIATCIDGAISGGIRHIYDPSKNISDAFVWQLFQSQKIQDQMQQFVSGRGSSLAHAGGVIEDLAMAYNAVLIHKYQSIIDPMYRLYVNNQLESQQLAQLRDWLLPMLMSGQVVVK